MMDMINRVAKELEGFFGCTPGRAQIAARAAIEAMREPTKPMVFYGMDAMSRDDLEPTEEEFTAGYQAAIRCATGQFK